MEFTTLGRTGLKTSVVGLGCGGHSRIGLAVGGDERQAIGVVRHALDLGINFIDTAAAYRTEPAVGKAIAGRRDDVVVSTKATIRTREGGLISGDALRASLHESLKRLGTDYVDVFHLHGVTAEDYPYCVQEFLPVMLSEQASGSIRYLGVTERFSRDTGHEMLQAALPDDHFDVIMVGFNLLNPSARARVFPATQEHRVGTLIMFAVRRSLSRPDALAETLDQLAESGQTAERVNLDFVANHPDVGSLVEGAYRFCRHEPGADIILTGTSSTAHLAENVASILAPPLPVDVSTRLAAAFGNVDSVSGN